MYDWVERIVQRIWQPLSNRYARMHGRGRADGDGYEGQWSTDLEQHAFGEYSFAVIQANQAMEDFSQVEVGHNATFVGVYDGHGGREAAWFVREHLFNNLIRFAQEREGLISEQILRNAFTETEQGFIYFAREALKHIPNIYSIGSCCLVGIIWNRRLFVANLGDSRAVLGRANPRNLSKVIAQPLTNDHNASMMEVRRDLQLDHPEDPNIVVRDEHGVWRVKGIIQISRSIGDLYLKSSEFDIDDPNFPRFRLTEPINKPVLRSDPTVQSRDIETTDRFIVFASDGLWDNLSDQKAIDIVQKNPRSGIAKRLIKKALEVAAKKQGRKYKAIRKFEMGRRRTVHDDITVVVLYIDHHLVARSALVTEVSMKAFEDSTESQFKYIHGGASTSGTGGTLGFGGASTFGAGGASSSGAGGASSSGAGGASSSGAGGASGSGPSGASGSGPGGPSGSGAGGASGSGAGDASGSGAGDASGSGAGGASGSGASGPSDSGAGGASGLGSRGASSSSSSSASSSGVVGGGARICESVQLI
ncbi:probable protein phosphatase 2C 43 [Lactuca sativa]|uniref:probable protein phosphatase 2C 43 n=1 Tax=Lactuca sativa TaxID=4236 RepID=UPI000CD96B5B|nr:probable protein phosphatase 2C 43 [Lactuca sativa]